MKAVSMPYDFEGNIIWISASIGAAGYSEAAAWDGDLLQTADHAIYQAKEAGQGQVVWATAGAKPRPSKGLALRIGR